LRLGDAVAVTDNWNHALSAARGQYVVMLGDDDALAPGYFEDVAAVIARHASPDVVHLAAYFYCYPSVLAAQPEGYFSIGLNSPLFVGRFDPYLLPHDEAVALAGKAMRLHHYFPFNSQNFVWKRASMPHIARSGAFFKSLYPDFYAAIMTFLNAERIVVDPHPRVIIGISPKSFGYYFNNDEQAAGSSFLGHATAATLLADPDVLPGSEHNTKWLLAAKAVRASMGTVGGLRVGVRNYRRLQIVDAVRRAGPGGDPEAIARIWPRLTVAERVLAGALRTALRAAKWHRPASQGQYILGKVDRVLDQHFPPVVTKLPLGPHSNILDAVRWLEGPAPIEEFKVERAGTALANPYLSGPQQRLLDGFHDLYYSLMGEGEGVATIGLTWLGTPLFKCPMDLWLYQEIITNHRPDVIVETGTYRGGSAHYLATLCQLIGHGRVVTVDINPWPDAARPDHDRLTYLTGSSTDPQIVAHVRDFIGSSRKVLVILDSDHSLPHVLAELRTYQEFVPVGGLMVVEDTNVNGHPTFASHGPGPWEAVEAFLAETSDFIADRSLERFLLTMNPRGYLRRVARSSRTADA
jgi:cephalosporin hydroxylase